MVPIVALWLLAGFAGNPAPSNEKVGHWCSKQPSAAVVAVGTSRQLHCTGFLVDRQTIVTARHCLPATVAFFGRDTRTRGQWRAVTEMFSSDKVDLAWLRLENSFAGAKPLQLMPDLSRRGGRPASFVRAFGFGARDTSGQSRFGRLHSVAIPVRSAACTNSKARLTGCLPSIELVLEHTGGRDTCRGDSGGPLFQKVGGICKYRLWGVTSRTIDFAAVACGVGGIYVAAQFVRPPESDSGATK